MKSPFYPADIFWMAGTLLISIAITMLPLSSQIQLVWPEFCLLTLIYWGTHRNNQGFIFIAFLCGLLLDILNHNTMGIHAVAYTIILFLLSRFYPKLSRQTFLRQIEVIAMLLFLNAILVHTLLFFLNDHRFSWKAILPVISGILLWPWIMLLYNGLTRRSSHSNNA